MAQQLLGVGVLLIGGWIAWELFIRPRYRSSSLAMRQAEYLIEHEGLWTEPLPASEMEYNYIDPDDFEQVTRLLSYYRNR